MGIFRCYGRNSPYLKRKETYTSTMEQFSGKVLAANFFTHRTLNVEAIAQTFKPLWHTNWGFEVKDMGNHIVLFVFAKEFDTDRVFVGKPWSYDKHLISLQKMDKNMPVKDLAFMNPSAACAIGSSIGAVQESLKEWGTQDGSSFMRIGSWWIC